jgi:hypothetical protein
VEIPDVRVPGVVCVVGVAHAWGLHEGRVLVGGNA